MAAPLAFSSANFCPPSYTARTRRCRPGNRIIRPIERTPKAKNLPPFTRLATFHQATATPSFRVVDSTSSNLKPSHPAIQSWRSTQPSVTSAHALRRPNSRPHCLSTATIATYARSGQTPPPTCRVHRRKTCGTRSLAPRACPPEAAFFVTCAVSIGRRALAFDATKNN